MADTKKGGNSIVWSWREVGVENCTCMSVAAGMYCGPERTPGIANDSPCGTSCGRHCWDLGYVDAATGYFISKGFPVCGGPDAPPTPDPIAWVEFPTLTDLNTDGVPPCQRRATGAAFMQQAGLQAELQDQIFRNTPTISYFGFSVNQQDCDTDPDCGCRKPNPNGDGTTVPGCANGGPCWRMMPGVGENIPGATIEYKCGGTMKGGGPIRPTGSGTGSGIHNTWQKLKDHYGGGWFNKQYA